MDHGKTTLLDYIRKSSVAAREAGGITQSIGAYEIEHNGRKITFIDTPGHEAFSRMRGYGAKIADLAILIVAADDSVKPQTKDALKYILNEKIPFVVAINKIDKPGANIEKVKSDLMQSQVLLEGYGGSVSWHAISAKTGEGVSGLLDLLLLAADVENLEYDEKLPAEGSIVSVKLDSRRGLVVGAIIYDGTLRVGENIAASEVTGKVKILENFLGKGVKLLVPSAPALIVGFEKAPRIGDIFVAGEDANERVKKVTAHTIPQKNVDQSYSDTEDRVKVILKADEVASLEALEDMISRLNKTMPLVTITSSIGNIHETDVKDAGSTGAVIVGFRVKADRAAENLAEGAQTRLFLSPIIYELEKQIIIHTKRMNPAQAHTITIVRIFGEAKGKERVIGGKVTLGPIKNQEEFEVWNDVKMIGTGKILNLQSNRANATSVETGAEVGLLVESETTIKPGHRLLFINE